MNDLLDRAVKSAIQDYFDAAPEHIDTPLEPTHRISSRSRTPIGAAASVVVIGVGGLIAVRLGDGPDGRGAASITESTVVADPTSTTVLVVEQTYIVRAGDFLADIAERHCVTIHEIADYNAWTDGINHSLAPGDPILIPPDGCAEQESPGGSLTEEGASSIEQAMVPTVFPVVPDMSASEARGTFSQNSWGDGNPPRVDAALGRIEDDGTMVDGVVVQVGMSFIGETPDQEAVTVFGQDATLYRDAGSPIITTVVWGGGPFIAVLGEDPMAFLDEASVDFVTIESYDNGTPAALKFNELPPGYEVVVESAPLALGSVNASLLVPDQSGGDGQSIEVSVSNPLLSALTVGPVSPVEVNGEPGWLIGSSGTSLTWQADDSTYVQIWGTDTADAALELARSIEWVDAGTWMSTYDVALPVFPPGLETAENGS